LSIDIRQPSCHREKLASGILFRLLWLALAVLAVNRPAAPAVTYHKDIAPILFEHCAACHRPGEAGGFPLLTYAEARKRSRIIEQVTRTRYMPPWLPEPGFGEFTDENRLTAQQIATIREWVRAGAPEGNPADSPRPPVFTPGWQLGQPDLILTVPKPFSVPADGPDLFWNFVISPAVTQTRYVRSVEVRPGSAASVHHANLLIDRSRSARRQEKNPGSGFAGMDLNIETPVFDPDSHFLFWKPGGKPWVEPAGMSWSLGPGSDLVLNVHFHPTGKPELVQPSVGLYFTAERPTQSPMLLQIERDNTIDISPGARDFVVSEDFRLPVDVTVIAVYPHAHYLGTLLEGYATLPDGSRRWLVRIPQWDLNWQAVYHFRTPVFLPRGTVVSMRFHYDNSAQNPRNPNVPPRRVTAGNQSTDEMGHLWLQLLAEGSGDARAVLQESLMRRRLANDPSNAGANFSLGSLLLGRKDYSKAIPHFEEALRLNPDQPLVLNNLGAALQGEGHLADAASRFTQALRLDPGYASARFNLANVFAAQGRWKQAEAEYRNVIASNPADAGAREQFVALLIQMANTAAQEGRLADAAASFRELIIERPADADLRNNFGVVLAKLGDWHAAAAQFQAAVVANPLHQAARRNLAMARRRLSQH
jgi:tetratricopeptide (TPR) repeat protein/mono/diheme cytochrome c family protein